MADYPKMIYKDFAADPTEYLIVNGAAEETKARRKGWRNWDEPSASAPDPAVEVTFTPADPTVDPPKED
jgi:hypothetical protein